MTTMKRIQSTIADVETGNLLGRYEDQSIYTQIKSNLDGELKNVKDDVSQTRLRVRELGQEKKWLDWIGKYGAEIKGKGKFKEEQKQEYINGVVSKIKVYLDNDTNEHTLKISFNLPMVNDAIEYKNPKDKRQGYKVIEGDTSTDLLIPVGTTKGKYPRKTKNVKKKSTNREKHNPLTPSFHGN